MEHRLELDVGSLELGLEMTMSFDTRGDVIRVIHHIYHFFFYP